MQKTLFITGGAGYVGQMLVDQYAGRDDVKMIIALDKEAEPSMYKSHKNRDKLVYVHANTSDKTWQSKVAQYKPEIVIHTAWQIREIYGNRPLSYKWNIDGSDEIFDFCLENNFVERLVYFSTVASYGAFADNSLDYRYVETDPFRKTNYLYAEEKRWTEEHLEKKIKDQIEKGGHMPIISVVRPAAISGPRGRYDRVRFGLQAALSGHLKGNFVYKIISAMVSFVPVTPKWLRQYIHEDDVCDLVALLAFDGKVNHKYEVFNICPPGDVVLGPDMAKAVGKRALPIRPWMARLAFFFFWHVTRGRIPTAEGSWKGYSYPIAVDGSKLTKMYGYNYKFGSRDAFTKNEGRYAKLK
jgi:nucleoside-diphosphate-sugar epimerase